MNREFIDQCVSIDCQGEQLLLHPDRVIYWPARSTLLAADIHVGKEYTFSRAGIPVPGGISEATLSKLMHNVDNSAAERLLVLGDLLHATPHHNELWQPLLSTLLAERSTLSVQVIIGNHDSKQARDNVQANLQWHHSLPDPPFVFTHEPVTHHTSYVIAGHIHPVHRLKSGRHHSLRTPVFWFRQSYAVLPAFGEFTGGHPIKREPQDRVFMIGQDQVAEV